MDSFLILVGLVGAVLIAYLAGCVDGRAAQSNDQRSRTGMPPTPVPVPQKPWPDPFPDVPLPVAVGERFVYMRVPMICTAHVMQSPYGGFMPGVIAEYVAGDGKFVSRNFSGPELDALTAELGRHLQPRRDQ